MHRPKRHAMSCLLLLAMVALGAIVPLDVPTASSSPLGSSAFGLVLGCREDGWLQFNGVSDRDAPITLSFADTGLDPESTSNELKSAFPLTIPARSVDQVNWSVPTIGHVALDQWSPPGSFGYLGPYGLPRRFVPTDPFQIKGCGEFPVTGAVSEPFALRIAALDCQSNPASLDALKAYEDNNDNDAYLSTVGGQCVRSPGSVTLGVRDVTGAFSLGAVQIGADGRGTLPGINQNHVFEVRKQPGDQPARRLLSSPMVLQTSCDTAAKACYTAVVSIPEAEAALQIEHVDSASREPVPGACFLIHGPAGATLPAPPGDTGPLQGEVCDSDYTLYTDPNAARLSDASPDEGVVRVEGLTPGVYTASETVRPFGYVLASPVEKSSPSIGPGSTFTVRLPLAPVDDLHPA